MRSIRLHPKFTAKPGLSRRTDTDGRPPRTVGAPSLDLNRAFCAAAPGATTLRLSPWPFTGFGLTNRVVNEHIALVELMETSGIKFGTSGARGLITALTDRVAYAYASGFLQYLEKSGQLRQKSAVCFAGDRRASTGRIQTAIARAILDRGHQPMDFGTIPTPALALLGLEQRIPSIMVTGSHIPDDRNGIKFNTHLGEISKKDEAGIAQQSLSLPDIFDSDGSLKAAERPSRGEPNPAAARAYMARYLQALPEGALEGLRLGFYGHSAVGRDLIPKILEGLGAKVTALGFSESFVSVDTEAIRPEDARLAQEWSREQSFDSILSTDGDSDRPLISDERGMYLRGDIAGILSAQYLNATDVVTPVSSNSAAERCGSFRRVVRTRIGSPYVIEAMSAAVAEGGERVVGYEANGGFLTASPIPLARGTLAPLPTRDAVIPMLSILARARSAGAPVSSLLASLPPRFTASDRITDFPADRSRPRLEELKAAGAPAVEALLGADLGLPRSIDNLDGIRIEFQSGDVLHFRASGNAPELRCYSEASTPERAQTLLELGLSAVRAWR